VTSAEAVLIEEQSYTKLLDVLAAATLNNTKNNNNTNNNTDDDDNEDAEEIVVCVGISPNSRASLVNFLQGSLPASAPHLSQSDIFLRVASALKSIGVTYVLDTSSTGDVALVEAREEFLDRYRIKQQEQQQQTTGSKSGAWVTPTPTTAMSATVINSFKKAPADADSELEAVPVEVGYPG
jgi:iron only hydrogenase large subunit-like protein